MGKKKFVAQEYTAATDGKGLDEGTPASRFFTRLTIFFSVSGILLSVAVVAFTLIFMLSEIKGTSMMTTLNATGYDTDSILANKAAKPGRGDIIITKLYSADTNLGSGYKFGGGLQDNYGYYEYIIKRLIALPGDTLEVRRELKSGGRQYEDSDYIYDIYVNGERLDESRYLTAEVAHRSAMNFITLYRALENETFRDDKYYGEFENHWANDIADGVLTVPAGYWFYMGDNRGGNFGLYKNSWDCSYFGPQKMEHYIGRGDDVLPNDESVPEYLWRKFQYYVLFGWVADL